MRTPISLSAHRTRKPLRVMLFFFLPFCSFTSSRAPACRCSLNNPPDNTPLNGTVKRGMLCARKNANTFSVSSQKTNGKRQCTLWVSLNARKPNIYTIKAWYFYLTGGSKRRTYVCVCLFVCLFVFCCVVDYVWLSDQIKGRKRRTTRATSVDAGGAQFEPGFVPWEEWCVTSID